MRGRFRSRLLTQFELQVNRDDDLASAEDYMLVARWNLAMLNHKLGELAATQSMRSASTAERRTACDLLSWLLQPDPKDRPESFKAVLSHMFCDPEHGIWRMSDLHVRVADGECGGLSRLPPDAIDSSNHPFGATPLHIAVAETNPPAVEALLEQGADSNKADFMGRIPMEQLLVQLQRTASGDERQLKILGLLSKWTKYETPGITKDTRRPDTHSLRAEHLVNACKAVCGGPWNSPLAQLLLQKSGENAWLDACEKLVENGANLDESSGWDARTPREIGMASGSANVRDYFRTHGTVRIFLRCCTTNLFHPTETIISSF